VNFVYKYLYGKGLFSREDIIRLNQVRS